MSDRIKKKLSLRRETLRDLTADQLSLIAGGNQGELPTNARGCERSGIVGHCEVPSHWFNCGDQKQQPTAPGQTVKTLMQVKSLAYCLDRPPLSGRTLPPSAVD